MTFKLVAKVDNALKPDVIKWSAFYEHRIKLGSVSASCCISTDRYVLIRSLLQKMIFHLEAFVAKFMRIYER